MTKPTRPPDETPPPAADSPSPPGFKSDPNRPTAPQLRLEISKDGGATWWPMPSQSLGAIGEYARRLKWHRLGSGRNLVLRFSCSEPIPLAVLNAVVNAEAGES